MNYDLNYFQTWLDGYVNFERSPDAKLFRLETTERLAGLFGHPELSYKTYHVTGSKGKGSVSKMIACILAEMEGTENVGVYASPHVYDFRERVARANGFFENEVYNKTVEQFTKTVDSLPDKKSCGSWFELNAAFAFLLFKNAGAKHAVFEVGMGGRLDATNIIRPEICCITEIELEHTEFLGNTLEKIAREKAGIIKERTPVVVAAQKKESVREVFREVAKERKAPIYFVDEMACVQDLKYEDKHLTFRISGGIFRQDLNVRLKMLGQVQAKNAMQAAVAMKILYPEITEEVIERGLEKASLPGRFEMRGNLVLDGSHTVESTQDCVSTFKKLFPDGKRNLLFGIAAGKDVENIVPKLAGFDKIFITRPGDFKKSDLKLVEKTFKEAGMEVVADKDYVGLIKTAIRESDGKPLLAVGSFYLIDEVNKVLEN